MPLLPQTAERHLQPELIDQPELEAARHADALRGLERINFWSGSAGILWPSLRDLARRQKGEPLRVLDVATGAGDLPTRLFHRARRANLPLRLDGCDISGRAIEHAQSHARANGADVRFFVCDALRDPLPTDYDVVMCSLFLHHLTEPDATGLLSRMAAAARRMVLVNDLRRSAGGFWLAWLGTRVLSRSDVVHVDGPRSVEGAFSLDEVRGLCRDAGLAPVTLSRRWPCRYLLGWRKPDPERIAS